MYQRTDTQGNLMLEKAIFLEDVYSNMTSRERKFKNMFHKPSLLNKYLDTSMIGELPISLKMFLLHNICVHIS